MSANFGDNFVGISYIKGAIDDHALIKIFKSQLTSFKTDSARCALWILKKIIINIISYKTDSARCALWIL